MDPLTSIAQARSADLDARRLKALVRAGADMIWTVSSRGDRFLDISAWRAFTGQTTSQIENGGWLRAIHPLDRVPTIRRWLKAVHHGLLFRIDHRVRRFDGAYRVFRACAAPISDDHGNVIEWIGMHTDITEQAAAFDQVKESEQQFRKLFNSDLIGITIRSLSGVVHEANDEFLRIIGYSRQELQEGKIRWDDMTPSEFKAAEDFHSAEVIERGSCRPFEKEYQRKDGTRVPVLVGFTLLDNYPLSEARFIGFTLDISARKRVEADQKVREASFRELADSIPQLVFTTDAYGRKEYCNERYFRYTGLRTLRDFDLHWLDHIHPEDRAATRAAWLRAVETGEQYQCEYRLLRADGAYRYFLARGLPSRNESGEIVRWLGSCTDIHDQKLAEQSMRRSEKLAVTGKLAANLAHEINNPLTGVMNSLYLALQHEALPEGVRAYLKTAEQELLRVSHLTTRTLQFHRQAGKPASFDICLLMDSVLNVFVPRLHERHVTVSRRYSNRGTIFGYADDLRHALANVLSNSLDALSDGGRLQIRIRGASRPETAEPGIRLTIADNGVGLASDLNRRVFEPFFSTKEATGTGLGLWMTQSIIQKHAGVIRFRSSIHARNHGTVVSIFLPRVAHPGP